MWLVVFCRTRGSCFRSMGKVIDTIIGVAVFLLLVGTAIGWLINVFTGSGGSHSDFDTKDPGDHSF